MSKIDEIISKILKESYNTRLEQCPALAIYKFTVGDGLTRLACDFHLNFLKEHNKNSKAFEYKKLIEIELSYNHRCECLQFKEGKEGV